MGFIQPAISAACSDASNCRSTAGDDGGAGCARIAPTQRAVVRKRELVITPRMTPLQLGLVGGHFIGREMGCPMTASFHAPITVRLKRDTGDRTTPIENAN